MYHGGGGAADDGSRAGPSTSMGMNDFNGNWNSYAYEGNQMHASQGGHGVQGNGMGHQYHFSQTQHYTAPDFDYDALQSTHPPTSYSPHPLRQTMGTSTSDQWSGLRGGDSDSSLPQLPGGPQSNEGTGWNGEDLIPLSLNAPQFDLGQEPQHNPGIMSWPYQQHQTQASQWQPATSQMSSASMTGGIWPSSSASSITSAGGDSTNGLTGGGSDGDGHSWQANTQPIPSFPDQAQQDFRNLSDASAYASPNALNYQAPASLSWFQQNMGSGMPPGAGGASSEQGPRPQDHTASQRPQYGFNHQSAPKPYQGEAPRLHYATDINSQQSAAFGGDFPSHLAHQPYATFDAPMQPEQGRRSSVGLPGMNQSASHLPPELLNTQSLGQVGGLPNVFGYPSQSDQKTNPSRDTPESSPRRTQNQQLPPDYTRATQHPVAKLLRETGQASRSQAGSEGLADNRFQMQGGAPMHQRAATMAGASDAATDAGQYAYPRSHSIDSGVTGHMEPRGSPLGHHSGAQSFKHSPTTSSPPQMPVMLPGRSASDFSSMEGTSSYQHDLPSGPSAFENRHQQGSQDVQSRGNDGRPRRDSDSTRLSYALANTQLGGIGPSPLSRDGTHSTPTIVEEEEEATSALGAMRQNGALVSGPAFPAPTTMPLQSFPGQRSSEVRGEDSSRQRNRNGPAAPSASARPFQPDQQHSNFYASPQQGGPQQIQVQDRDSSNRPAAPTVLQRKYKPAVRPTTYQQLAILNLNGAQPPSPHQGLPYGGSAESMIDDMIRHFITCPSRLGLGERTVLIMTSKVAQKSYGTEKRFLCPPPMVLMIGSSWWNACPEPAAMQGFPSAFPGMNDQHRVTNAGAPTTLIPPRLQISMSGETINQEGSLEWATSSGRLIDVGNPSSEMAVSGRCIGKQLYITDFDEKRRSCEALVSVSVPGRTALDNVQLGTFASKPVKIISKPSKKRQSNRNTELSIAHGSIVSMFHRLRSQTVSTRYLCVSGAPTWFKGSDGQAFLTLDQPSGQPSRVDPPSCFVAKMTSWDPFIIYLVDPHYDAQASDNVLPSKPPVSGYPPPPPCAMHLPQNGSPITIHYNQKVVLQCLNTAVVSPILVIRKVEKATTVVGGAAAGSAKDESIGDPVSQLHKIALEVAEDSQAKAPSMSDLNQQGRPASTPGSSGPFLACLNESVGMRRPAQERKWMWTGSQQHQQQQLQSSASGRPSTPGTPRTPAQSHMMPGSDDSDIMPPPSTVSHGGIDNKSILASPTATAAAFAAAQTHSSMMHSRQSSSTGHRVSIGSGSAPYATPTQMQQQQQAAQQGISEGGKVRRPRRVSSSMVPQGKNAAQASSSASAAGSQAVSPAATAVKGRRRGQSLSTAEWQSPQWPAALGIGSGSEPDSARSSFSMPGSGSSMGSLGSAWSVEISDSDVWTIVGTDIARHTFYIPPLLVGGVNSSTNVPDSGIAHLITTPAPSRPITPMPVLNSFIPPMIAEDPPTGRHPTSTSNVPQQQQHLQHPEQQQQSQPYHHQEQDHRQRQRLVTLFGDNFSDDLYVYFGDWRSTHVEVQSPTTILCAPPPPASEAFEVPDIRLPVMLVRKDGVIFPTECIYSTT